MESISPRPVRLRRRSRHARLEGKGVAPCSYDWPSHTLQHVSGGLNREGFLKVSRWSPRRTRFYHKAPKMAEIVRRVDAERRLAELWMFPRCGPPCRDIVAATCPAKCRPMRWPCRGDTGKLISPCSDGATCSRSFLRFDHEKRHHDKQQECGDQSIFERHRAYPSRNHSWARRCAAPALAGCAHAVS